MTIISMLIFTLPNLPYDDKALEPYISSETISYHYNKHHQNYVNGLNKFLEDNSQDKSDYRNKNLEEVIKLSNRKKQTNKESHNHDLAIFNNAAQVWNHNFYWNSMINVKTEPSKELKNKLIEDFGSFEKFLEIFKNNSIAQFGSGWVWLIFNKNNKKLEILKTSNADTPIVDENLIPLITIDVWEHSYYIDYKNKRNEYVDNFIQHLFNWNFANQNFEKCHQR